VPSPLRAAAADAARLLPCAVVLPMARAKLAACARFTARSCASARPAAARAFAATLSDLSDRRRRHCAAMGSAAAAAAAFRAACSCSCAAMAFAARCTTRAHSASSTTLLLRGST
jgi:hypothetical protein